MYFFGKQCGQKRPFKWKHQINSYKKMLWKYSNDKGHIKRLKTLLNFVNDIQTNSGNFQIVIMQDS